VLTAATADYYSNESEEVVGWHCEFGLDVLWMCSGVLDRYGEAIDVCPVLRYCCLVLCYSAGWRMRWDYVPLST